MTQRRVFAISAVLLFLAIGASPIVVNWYLTAQRKPFSETRGNLYTLSAWCEQYHTATGEYPQEETWARQLVLFTLGERDFLEGNARELLDCFYDGWNRPFRYRLREVRDPARLEIFSVGPNGRDENGGGDDISTRKVLPRGAPFR